MSWTFNPFVVPMLVMAVILHVRAVRVLAGRGVRVSRWQIASWHGGVALTALALLGPFDHWGELSLSGHMAQHLIIADLAAPLLLAGLRWPVHVFLLPRPALVALARRRRLRQVMRRIRQPLVAIPIYVLVLYGWHFDVFFVAAVQSDVVHALQHQTFVAASLLVWWSALEPEKRRMPGELWKIGHILGARLPGMMLGMAFIATRLPVYTDAYGASGERLWGMAAVADQQTAGAMMLSLDAIITFLALTMFFWRSASDHDRREPASAA